LNDTKSGIIFLQKPEGITSFKVLNTLKNKLGTNKIGHTGTLDKFASGVLLVLIGKMTKLADFFNGMDKEYEAVFYFGKQTNTLDPEGDVIKTAAIPQLSEIKQVIRTFIGEINQTPPIYSAIHINGERAYKRALKGETPVLRSRKVTIHNFIIQKWDPPCLSLRVSCSKGTYVRSLARDVGEKLHSCAYVLSLKRTKVGPVAIENTVLPENFIPSEHLVHDEELFNLLPDIQVLKVDDIILPILRNGGTLKKEMFPTLDNSFNYFALFHKNIFIALIHQNEGAIKYNFISKDAVW